jgi:hypothetical protein
MFKNSILLRWLFSVIAGLFLWAGSGQLYAQDGGNRNMTGSKVETFTTFYTPGGNGVVLNFQTTFVSPDLEYLDYAVLDFPTGVTVTSASIMQATQFRWLNWNGQTGNGANPSWGTYDGVNDFYLVNGNVAPFTVTVNIAPGFTGDMNIGWTLYGDEWGAIPHVTSGTMTILEPQPLLRVTPLVLNLGERPIGAWMEAGDFMLENVGTGPVTVNASEIDAPGFFALLNPEFPYTLEEGETVAVGLYTPGEATPGVLNGNYVAQWGAGRSVTVAEFTATAYTPVQGDVYELAFPVASFPFTSNGVSTASFRANYDLPGAITDGKDAVYAFTLANDRNLSVNLTGTNAKMAIYEAPFGINEGPMDGNELYSAGASAANLELFAGSYYLVVSTTGASYDLNITSVAMPNPGAVTYIAPADGAINIINGMQLQWAFGANTHEYQLILGTTYPPTTVMVDWTANLATSYTLTNLQPNLQYFWKVNVRNSNGSTMGDVWGFTTTITPPAGLTGNAEVYLGQNVVLTWDSPVNRAFLGYNVYRNGVKINGALVTNETYTDVAPAYNMTAGYNYNVTSVFDEGESAYSNTFNAKVTGMGTVNGNVKDQLTNANLAGVTVYLAGIDEHGNNQTYTFTTNASGNYSGNVWAGVYDYRASKDGYIPSEIYDVAVAYNTTVTRNFILLEVPFPVDFVIATELTDETVLLEWGFDMASFVPQQYPFDTKGMSEEQIARTWQDFLGTQGFEANGNLVDSRSLVEFQVWRQKVYQPESMEQIGTTSQFQFVDFDWGVQDWGVYRWYIVAVYDANQSNPVGSNTLDKDMNTMVDVAVTLNSNESPAGTLVQFTNTSEPDLGLTYNTILGGSGVYTWNAFRRGTYDIAVTLSGYEPISVTGIDIFDESSFAWLLTEILAVPTDLYVTPTGYATWVGGSSSGGGGAAFEPVMEAFDEGIPADWSQIQYSGDGVWEFCDNCGAYTEPINTDGKFAVADSDGNSDLVFDVGLFTAPLDLTGETAIYLDYDRNFQDYVGLGEIAIRVYSGGTGAGNFEEELDWATNDDPVGGIHKTYMIDPSGYEDPSEVYFEFWYSTNEDVYAWGFGIDNVLVTNEATDTRSFQVYKVFLDGVLVAEVNEPHYQYGTNGEELVDGQTYLAEVAAVFTTGQSEKASYVWTYIACDNYAVPGNFTAEQIIGTLNIELNWTIPVIPPAEDQIDFTRIYRDGEIIAEVEGNTFTDVDLAFGTYEYCVTFIYESGAETCVGGVCADPVTITGGGFVNGTVTEFDGGEPIPGALVTVWNEDYSFEFTTNAAGFYEGEVVFGTYNYLVEAENFESQTLENVVITFGATVTKNFALKEFPFPACNVVAVDNGTNASITWNTPGGCGAGGSVYEEFDNGMPSLMVLDNPPSSWSVANSFLNLNGTGTAVWRSAYYNLAFDNCVYETEMQRTVGSPDNSMGIYVRGTGFMNPNVGSGEYANVFTITQGGYYWYATLQNGDLMGDWTGWLTTSAINTTGPNVLSAVTSGTTVQFFVNGILVHTVNNTTLTGGYCGMFAYDGDVCTTVWDYLSIEPGAVVRSFATTNEVGVETKGTLAKVYSTPHVNTVEPKGIEYHSMQADASRELLGYNVWRSDCYESGDPVFLGYTLDTSFVDNQWPNQPAGVYKYGVEALYTYNSAEVQFSNCLDKDMITQVSVQVTTNSLDSPEGTDVAFVNTSEPDLGLIYEAELDATGFYAWDEFRKGTYDISVELNGFAPVYITGYVIDGPEAFEWVLEELLNPVADLYVTPTGYATWRDGGIIPFEPFMENFNEGLPDTWTVVDGGSTNDTWYNTPNYSGNSLDGTPFMFANSDAAGPGTTMDEQLISPIIPNTENADELYLMWDYIYQYIGSEFFAVDVFDGNDWVEVFIKQADTGPFPWGPTVTETIDVTEYANENFQVRFHYVSNGWNWYVAVDNVVVTDQSERYADRHLEYYKVWLDGTWVTDTENTFWQYDTENLVPGQSYFAEVAAVYTNGMSAKMNYTWTYWPCEYYAGPESFEGEVIDQNDVLLTWSDVIPMQLVEITQNPGAPANGYYQFYDYGYGVAYDLSAYPDALVNSLNFHHASWGTYGTWDFNIHVYNWDTKTLIATLGPFQTTGNDLWEMGIDLGDVSTGGAQTVALLMEPLSNSPTDAYPDLSSDNEANPQGSIYGPLDDVNSIGSSGIGNFLMEMYIYTAYGAVQATPVSFDFVKAPAATSRIANPFTSVTPVINQVTAVNANREDPYIGANVWRDGLLIAELVQDTFYIDMNVEPGLYNYCLTYVYESGAQSCPDANCVEIELAEECTPPFDLTAELEGTNTVHLAWNQVVAQEFRYDDGTSTGQLGFTGGTINSVLGAKHPESAELTEMSWLLTAEGGPHTTVQIYVFGLTGAGMPDGNNVLYTASVSNTDLVWNTHTFPTPIVADGGFFLGVGFNGFAGLGTDDGVGAPWVFQNNTHYYVSDYTAGGWGTWESAGFSFNGLIRAMGVPSAVASFAVNEPGTGSGDLAYSQLAKPVVAGQPEWAQEVYNTNRAFVGYNIYKDGDLLEELWPETTYTYNEGTAGTNCYEVTAMYSLCGESDPSNEACVDITVGVGEQDILATRIYPNPSNSVVNIELTSNISKVVIYNYIGQVVYDQNVTNTQTIRIDAGSYESGAYLVKFLTNSGESFIKRVVIAH